ncbi:MULTISPECIES: tRNA dihydrouridine synthase DusB [Vibrio]|uniref:tRNA-dihydrouridine synthase B n=1 Tax=Vibrio natriegens NBRC 15636 = ATCC 14048 = DSM 759 TaxID=1219067 RepID=A0AAN0Y4H2_VIBNA|nr:MULTISPECIES: tRNA dihydrouridine synthase DusB [Vibrio]AEX23403.1 NifR3/Smm1 family protein [Vibrio sp. EJY3]ALR17300.1 tRNA-dihydrouridine synthase B [Vibrio natriegens NBRC 15636 = ATCC 14048 = DSM 759]ANQ14053.1 tRNA dihydrouridine synthase DusB [Vibrio natriegens NBRC 15636 = ATCC 14048 = DSM 759]ANQ23180.1 tRNA dihydrouridine synthase DusB [Vibrio natriegens]ANQ27911.1 tRNA dihydrouridine synthase DusB [Vibrio natriegens]
MRIGNYQLKNNLIVAPMAGVTDRPFRELCLRYGAGMAVSEMMSANPKLWKTSKSKQRMVHEGESGIRSVQIAGSDPQLMADAAQFSVENGAQIIDINMGCPAKKVNKKLAGSALLQYPNIIEEILKAVVNAVDVPVTLKTRTGWDTENKNCLQIAKLAEDCGIQALALHGRTKACMYKGEAEYDSIKAVKEAISIPVIANGDIDSPEKAKFVLEYTGADALMIGRPAQGRPWIFQEIHHYLENGTTMDELPVEEVKTIMLGHVNALHEFYGEYLGPRIARKHVGWYLKEHEQASEFRRTFNAIDAAPLQIEALEGYFDNVAS